MIAQVPKSYRSRKRKVWVVKLVDGSEYSAYVSDKQDAVAIARKNNLKVLAVYKTNERWSK